MKKFTLLALTLLSLNALAETKVICNSQEMVFNPKTGNISGKSMSDAANVVNQQIKTIESQGKRVKVVQQTVAFGGFQAVAAAVGSNFVNSQAVQYPTVCVTVEIE